MQIIYTEITPLEAMAKIDQGKIRDLYFVEYYVDDKFIEENHCFIPGDILVSDPIGYHEPLFLKKGFYYHKKKILAEPGDFCKHHTSFLYRGHKWLVKNDEIIKALRKPSPPGFKKSH